MRRKYEVNLKDILRRIEIIKENTKGMSYEEFKNNEWDVSAVVRNLEVIGEAVANLPDDFK
ncbi:MAG: HepT-like ribonuclease domain-containing protein, partial [Candidatus Thermoplasmatota archaeon]